jgi:hypothetical protein
LTSGFIKRLGKISVPTKDEPSLAIQSSWKGYALLCFAIASQLATIIITWPLWSDRLNPPNLPAFNLPRASFTWLMVISALLPLVLRSAGVWIHLTVLVVASCFDQLRLQPQFFFGWVFIWAAASEQGKIFCRWLLPATWFWAGLHKLLSPEWMGVRSYKLLGKAGVGIEDYHFYFAITVAVVEIVLGLLAIWRMRVAAIGCVLFHCGVVAFLWSIDWNRSVIPWNLTTALFGFWIFWNQDETASWSLVKRPKWELAWAVLLFTTPVLFYTAMLDHGFCQVLYSGMIPHGLISDNQPECDRLRPPTRTINGWGELSVPFPNEHRLLHQYFDLTALPGSKLHIADPRPWVDDKYFVKLENGTKRLSPAEFFASDPTCVMGIGIDDQQANFVHNKANVIRLARSKKEKVYAIKFEPGNFDRGMLQYLAGFPNLEQIQFAGCNLQNEDLVYLVSLLRLKALGLSNTQVTDAGLMILKNLPDLQIIEIEGSAITEEAVDKLVKEILLTK